MQILTNPAMRTLRATLHLIKSGASPFWSLIMKRMLLATKDRNLELMEMALFICLCYPI